MYHFLLTAIFRTASWYSFKFVNIESSTLLDFHISIPNARVAVPMKAHLPDYIFSQNTGCAPFNHPVAYVPQWLLGTIESANWLPAGPANLYQTSPPFQSPSTAFWSQLGEASTPL